MRNSTENRSKLRLYSTALSANGRKPLAVCRHLGLEPDVEEVNVYAGEGRRPEYLALHRLGKVPLLVARDEDGREIKLWESNAILVYLCEAWGENRLWAAAPRERAEIARWLYWEASSWQPALSAVMRDTVAAALFPGRVPPPKTPPDWGAPEVSVVLSFAEEALHEVDWFAGELTIADFSLGGMLTYARTAAFPFDDFPALARWYRRLESLPAWAATAVPPWR